MCYGLNWCFGGTHMALLISFAVAPHVHAFDLGMYIELDFVNSGENNLMSHLAFHKF
jgi:hypothetical protein